MKKGFTLIELLAVIIIIALTSTIVFPAISSIILNSKQDLYNDQILDIQAASEKWATENSNLLDKYHVNDVYITLELLRFTGYLERDEIKNPMNREVMEGCIQIKYDKNDKKYKYAYEEKTCNAFANSSSTDNGYIIYSYDTNKKGIATSDENKKQSIGQYIVQKYIDNNTIHTPGETTAGLYELDDEYVFRGEASNFVSFNYKDTTNLSARILSISKDDYSIKIIDKHSSGRSWTNDGVNFIGSTISDELSNSANTSGLLESNKITNYDFQIGKIDNQALSLRALKSVLSSKSDTNITDNKLTISNTNIASQKVGTISVLDYVNASATSECDSNFLSDSCKNNNYLNTMFGSSNTVWTLNNDGSNIWYILTDGSLGLENASNIKQVYPVYKLTSDVFVENSQSATGDEANPYIIK